MGGSAKTPAPNPTADYNQYLAEGSNALSAQDQLLRQQVGYEAGLQPLLTAQQMASLKGQSQGLLGLYGDLYDPAQAMQKRYAGDQLTMMGGFGQQATQAAIGSMDTNTRGIYDTFGQQALSDLQMGSSLNAQETNQAQQAARAAGAARGLSFSRQGGDLEILNTYNMGQKRQTQRQGVAQQAYQMGTAQQQIGLQGFLNPAFAASQQYGLSGIVQSAQAGYAGLGQSSFLQPESQYLANIRANRIQMETAIQSANASRSGSIIGGALGASVLSLVVWLKVRLSQPVGLPVKSMAKITLSGLSSGLGFLLKPLNGSVTFTWKKANALPTLSLTNLSLSLSSRWLWIWW